MDGLEPIRQWFREGCHFATGVAFLPSIPHLAKEHAGFVRYFSAHFIPDSVETRLRELLMAYLESQPTNSKKVKLQTVFTNPAPATPKMSKIFTPSPIETKVSEPPEIQSLREKARQLHKRHSLVHAEMGLVDSDAARFERAREIMTELIPALDRIYDAIRAWEKNGTLPAPVVGNDVARQLLKKYIHMDKTLRPRISRLKKMIKTRKNMKGRALEDAEVARYEKELLEKELEVEELKKELEV